MKTHMYTFFLSLAILSKIGETFESKQELCRIADSIARDMNYVPDISRMGKHYIITSIEEAGMIECTNPMGGKYTIKLKKELEEFVVKWVMLNEDEIDD